jgi:hypothetical protein
MAYTLKQAAEDLPVVPDCEMEKQRDEAREQRNAAQREVTDLRNQLGMSEAIEGDLRQMVREREEQRDGAEREVKRLHQANRSRPSEEQLRATLIRVLGREAGYYRNVLSARWADSVAEDIISALEFGEPDDDDRLKRAHGTLDLIGQSIAPSSFSRAWSASQPQLLDKVEQLLKRVDGYKRNAAELTRIIEEQRSRIAELEQQIEEEPEPEIRYTTLDEGIIGEPYVLRSEGDSVRFTQRVTVHPDGTIEVHHDHD